MKGMKNAVHGGILLIWALMGAALTIKLVFGGGAILAGMLTAGSYWLWLGGLAAVTSLILVDRQSPLSAFIVHFLAFVAIAAIPRIFPLNLLRLGLDLLSMA